MASDLHQQYGMDDADPGFWDQPFWRLRDRVNGLLDLPDSRLFHLFMDLVKQQQNGGAAGAA